MELIIRPAASADCEAVCALSNEIDGMHREALPHLFRKPEGPPRERSNLLGLFEDGNVGFFIAEGAPGILGYVHVIIRDTPEIPVFVPRRFAVIDCLVVAKEHREAGVGRSLMSRAEEWARRRGAESIELTVYEFNQGAIGFYATLGYETLRRTMARRL